MPNSLFWITQFRGAFRAAHARDRPLNISEPVLAAAEVWLASPIHPSPLSSIFSFPWTAFWQLKVAFLFDLEFCPVESLVFIYLALLRLTLLHACSKLSLVIKVSKQKTPSLSTEYANTNNHFSLCPLDSSRGSSNGKKVELNFPTRKIPPLSVCWTQEWANRAKLHSVEFSLSLN